MRFASRLRDRFLPERYHALATELFKFGAVGCVNTAVDFILVNALLFIGPLKAKIVAVVVATTISYLLNRQWTYKDRDSGSMRREYVLFFALNGVGLLIQEAGLAVAKYGLHFSETNPHDRLAFNVANAAGIGLAMIFRFWAYRTWVFTPDKEAREIEALEAAFSGTTPVAPDERQMEALEAAFSDPPAAPPAPRQPTRGQPARRRPTDELETPAAKR